MQIIPNQEEQTFFIMRIIMSYVKELFLVWKGRNTRFFGAQWGITLIMSTLSCICVFAAVT